MEESKLNTRITIRCKCFRCDKYNPCILTFHPLVEELFNDPYLCPFEQERANWTWERLGAPFQEQEGIVK